MMTIFSTSWILFCIHVFASVSLSHSQPLNRSSALIYPRNLSPRKISWVFDIYDGPLGYAHSSMTGRPLRATHSFLFFHPPIDYSMPPYRLEIIDNLDVLLLPNSDPADPAFINPWKQHLLAIRGVELKYDDTYWHWMLRLGGPRGTTRHIFTLEPDFYLTNAEIVNPGTGKGIAYDTWLRYGQSPTNSVNSAMDGFFESNTFARLVLEHPDLMGDDLVMTRDYIRLYRDALDWSRTIWAQLRAPRLPVAWIFAEMELPPMDLPNKIYRTIFKLEKDMGLPVTIPAMVTDPISYPDEWAVLFSGEKRVTGVQPFQVPVNYPDNPPSPSP